GVVFWLVWVVVVGLVLWVVLFGFGWLVVLCLWGGLVLLVLLVLVLLCWVLVGVVVLLLGLVGCVGGCRVVVFVGWCFFLGVGLGVGVLWVGVFFCVLFLCGVWVVFVCCGVLGGVGFGLCGVWGCVWW
ncbi:hypothetical protein RA281_27660, partial [Pseudomonas syringae pv. tagetis]